MNGPNCAGREFEGARAMFSPNLPAKGDLSDERRRNSPPGSPKSRRWNSSNIGHMDCIDAHASVLSVHKARLASSSVNMHEQASVGNLLSCHSETLRDLYPKRDTWQAEVSVDGNCSRADESRQVGEELGSNTSAIPLGHSSVAPEINVDGTEPSNKSRRQEATCICRRPTTEALVSEAQWQCSKCFTPALKTSGELSRTSSLPADSPMLKSQALDISRAHAAKHEVLSHGSWLSVSSLVDVPAGIRVTFECDQSNEVIPAMEIAARLRTRSFRTGDTSTSLKRKVDEEEISEESQVPHVKPQQREGSASHPGGTGSSTFDSKPNDEAEFVSGANSEMLSYSGKELSRTPSHRNSSEFKGVTWKPSTGQWYARICTGNNKVVGLGNFDDEVEAALKYDEAAATYNKPLNFPRNDTTSNDDAESIPPSSRFTGVHWNKGIEKWVSRIRHEGKLTHLGCFVDEVDAALKYDELAAVHGKPLNFPREEVSVAGDDRLHLKSSKYTGVSWHKHAGKWKSAIKIKGKKIHLGQYFDEVDAALKYDEVAAGIGRPLNIPQKSALFTDQVGRDVTESPSKSAKLERDKEDNFLSMDESSLKASSQYTGVYWCKRIQKWVSSIEKKGTLIYLGSFFDEKEAALKYDEAARDYHRPVNFPLGTLARSKAAGMPDDSSHNQEYLNSEDGDVPSSSSRHIGVYCKKNKKEWMSSNMISGKATHLGGVSDEKEAALCFDDAAPAFGKPLNFSNRKTAVKECGINFASMKSSSKVNNVKASPCGGEALSLSSSRYTGVYWHVRNRRWISKVKVSSKSVHLGSYVDEVEAALRYDTAAADLGRPLNFPESNSCTRNLSESYASKVPEHPTKRTDGDEEPLTKNEKLPPSSVYTGVGWNLRTKKWRSTIFVHGKGIHLGYFADEVEAALKYDEAAITYNKPLNFPWKTTALDAGGESASSSSKYIGVRWCEKSEKGVSNLNHEGKQTHLGYFTDEVDAAPKYDEAGASFGNTLNSPPETSHSLDTCRKESTSEVPQRSTKGFAVEQESWAAADGELSSSTSSQCTGVDYWGKKDGKWVSNIRVGDKMMHLGQFDDGITAALNNDEAAAARGESLNYPTESIPLGETDEEKFRSASVEEGVGFPVSTLTQSSKYTGVTWNKSKKKWIAKIKIHGKSIHLGYFEDEIEAAQRYDINAEALGRPLNFPEASFENLDETNRRTPTDEDTGLPTSKYTGVCWYRRKNRWMSRIRIQGKSIFLGYFEDEEDAARRYDMAAITDGRPLNFPEASVENLDETNRRTSTDEDTGMPTSRYIGVSWKKSLKRWMSSIKIHGRSTYLGYFHDEEEAARRYDIAAIAHGRPLNFPQVSFEIENETNRDASCEDGTAGFVSAQLSRYTGVSWNKRKKKWIVNITIHGKQSHLGYFDDEEEAARRYDIAAEALGKALNFPQASFENEEGTNRDASCEDGVAGFVSAQSSRYTGVCWNKRKKKWMVNIKIQGKSTYLGYFDDEEEAARRYDIAAEALGRALNFPEANTEKQSPESQVNVQRSIEGATLLAPTCAGQRLDASLIHCSEGPSTAIIALRSWLQPQILQQGQSAPLALVAGVKLLVSRMSEEPAGGWVASAGRSAPPHGTDAWRSSLYQAGLGSALADICRHWPGDAQLLESCLDAFCCLILTSPKIKVLFSGGLDQSLVHFHKGVNEVFDITLDQFGDCTRKGWLPVLRKLFEVFGHLSSTKEQHGGLDNLEMFSSLTPALICAVKKSSTSVGSISECKAIIRLCGRVVWNVVIGMREEGGATHNISKALFEAGILDAALTVCCVFSDSETVQYWGLKMIVSILYSYPPARLQAAELGIGRVAAALINRPTSKNTTASRTSSATAETFVVASQCLKYIPVFEDDALAFRAALCDAQIKATDTWSTILDQCALDSRWNTLYTDKQKKRVIHEYQEELRETQRKVAETKDGFLAMLEEHRHELNHMTSWSTVRHKLASDKRFKAIESRIERVELFDAFVASLCRNFSQALGVCMLGIKPSLDKVSDAQFEGHRRVEKSNRNCTAGKAQRQMSPQFKRVVSILCGPRGSSIACGQYFQDYFRGMKSEDVTNIFLKSFWRCFRVGALSGRWNLEMTEFNVLLYKEEDLDIVMQQYRDGSSFRLPWKRQINSIPLYLEPYIWMCSCSGLNFSDAGRCNLCSAPQLKKEVSELPSSGRSRGLPETWVCPNCARVNGTSRGTCSQCFCGRGVFRDELGRSKQIISVDSRKRARESVDSTMITCPTVKKHQILTLKDSSSSECAPVVTLKRATKLHFNMERLMDKLATPVQGRIHQLFARGELLPASLRYTILAKLQLLKVSEALALFDCFTQELNRNDMPPHDLLFKLLEKQSSMNEDNAPSKTLSGTPPLSPSQAELPSSLSTSSHLNEPAPFTSPVASEVRSIEYTKDDEEVCSDDEDHVHSSKMTADLPWKRLRFDERAAMLWASVESQRAQNTLHSKSKSPFSVLVDRDSIVESMFLASGRGMKLHSRSDGPIVNLLKPLRVTFGTYHLKAGSFGVAAEKKSWSSEGGGRGDKTEDLGGATAEAFSCFWDEVSSFEVATRAGWTGHLLQPEGEVLATMIDSELPAPGQEQSHKAPGGYIGDGSAANDCDVPERLQKASSSETREATLGHFEALGRVLLWALVQRQPIPSVIATPLFLGQLLGLDLIRGPLPHRLPESELCAEVLRCYPSLAWLIRGLREEMFTNQQTSSSLVAKVLPPILPSSTSSSTAPHVSLMALSFGAFEDDELLTPANREEKLRAALGSLLLDQRSEVMTAIRRGFTLDDTFDAVASSLGSLFTWPERQRLVSGEEKISAAAFVAIVEPQYPEDDESDTEEVSAADGNITADRDSSSGSASMVLSQQLGKNSGTSSSGIDTASLSKSSSTCTDPAILEANVALLFRVVRSERFEGLVVGLLRFITGCPSILDRSMRIKVEFVVGMSTATVPTAHTCFQTLYLSAAAYESEEQLARLLEICAHNSTSFGQK